MLLRGSTLGEVRGWTKEPVSYPSSCYGDSSACARRVLFCRRGLVWRGKTACSGRCSVPVREFTALPTADTPQDRVKAQEWFITFITSFFYSKNKTHSALSHSERKPLVVQRTCVQWGYGNNPIVKQAVVWPAVALQTVLSLCQGHWISLTVCFKLSGLLISTVVLKLNDPLWGAALELFGFEQNNEKKLGEFIGISILKQLYTRNKMTTLTDYL